LTAGQQVQDSFQVNSQDGTGHGTVTVTITGTNDAPTLSAITHGEVSESGLATGTNPLDSAIHANGTLTYGDLDTAKTALQIVVDGHNLGTLDGNASHTYSYTDPGHYGTIVFKGDGSWTYTLDKNVINDSSHNLSAPDTFHVQINDGHGGSSTSQDLTINIADDMPTTTGNLEAFQTAHGNTNLIIILDDSGSMGSWALDPSGGRMHDSSGHDMTKLDVAKEAINQLFTAYDNQGDVMVKLVAFNSSASEPGDSNHWMTISDAHTALANIQAGGNTNYDAALTTAMAAFDDTGKIAGAQNVSYFLSDGEPNQPSAHPGIDTYGTGSDVSITEWQTFVSGHDITSFALGMGSGATQSALNPIAYNGHSNVDTNAIVVDQWTDLSQTLVNTLHALPVSGNLGVSGSGTDGSHFGADGGHVASITVDGILHTYAETTGSSHQLSLDLAGGHGHINVDMEHGNYTYTPPTTISGDVNETIAFTLIDNDGDTASANLSILIDDPTHIG